MPRLILMLSGLLLAAAPVRAQFLPSELESVWPQVAVRGGEPLTVSVTGARLEQIERLIFSHPGITAEIIIADEKPQYGQFAVRADEQVPVGSYDVWAVGRNGVSNPRVFRVADVPVQPVAAPSHEMSTATTLGVPGIAVARATPAAVDYYVMEWSNKATLRLQLRGQTLDSRLIGSLQLINGEGKVIAEGRGGDAFDTMLQVPDLPTGTYHVAVRDFLYRGGAAFSYELRASVMEAGGGTTPLAQRVRGPDAATAVAWLNRAGERPDQPSLPQALELPHEGLWWFGEDHAAQHFEFSGTKGQVLRLEVISQRLGEPTDARLHLQRVISPEGEPLRLQSIATLDDSQGIGDGVFQLRSGDPVGVVTLPEDGRYQLAVRDLDVGESISRRQRYLLRIVPPQPRVTLIAVRPFPHPDGNQSRPQGSKLVRGGAELIRVLALREDGFAEPVTLGVDGLPAGVIASAGVIAANQSFGHVTLLGDAEALSDHVGVIRVTGTIAGAAEPVVALPATVSQSRGAGRELIQTRLTDALQLATSSVDLSPLTVMLGSDAVGQVVVGQAVNVPVRVTRREGGGGPVVVRPRDLPPGVTAAEITIPADQTEGNLEIKAAGNAAVGAYAFWVQAESKVSFKPGPEGKPQELTVQLPSNVTRIDVRQP